MTTAHPVYWTQARKLRALAEKGQLTKAALTAAGAAIFAATQAQAHSGAEPHHSEEEGSTVIGQGLIGATHAHQSGLVHSHGPLSQLPNGIQHTHAVANAPLTMAPAAPQQMSYAPAYTPAPMGAVMPNAYWGAPVAGSGGMVDGGLLLALGLAGMTGLAAMVLFGNDGDANQDATGTTENTPYLSNGDGLSLYDPAVLSFTSSMSQQAHEGEGGVLAYVSAHHPLGHDVEFSIIGGDDEERFTIDGETGAISFVGVQHPEEGDANESVPDYSALSGDADGTRPENGNNTLEVRVQVSDSSGNFANQTVTFFIQNDTRDDTVDHYREADDIDRMNDDDTNTLTDMIDAEFGQDQNGDNLLISVNGTDRVTVTELEGDGDVSTAFFGTSGADYTDIAVGDIDGDGDLDVVVAGHDDGENVVEVWESNGSGSFSLEYRAEEGGGLSTLDSLGQISDVVIGEFDGAGDLDIFVTNDGGDDSLITLSGNYSGDVETFPGLEADTESVVVSERYINSSTDYVASLVGGHIAWINVEDGEQEDEVAGDYVDLAVYRDMVFAAEESRIDVFEADSNSLESETDGIITGLDTITEIVVGDFDNDDSDIELAVLDAGEDEVYIYELSQYYDTATLIEVIDVDHGALELLTLPEFTEQLNASGGNLADDLLVGGSNSTIFYDDTSL